MKRVATTYLSRWYQDKKSKPLIIRGARQVGKSTLVRLFCQDNSLNLIEINFERETLKSLESEEFELNALLDEIQLKKRQVLTEKSLLFFDEIQESPKMLKLLRYFYEEAPHLRVVAAGSLLEIALKAQDFSFPVGRIQFLHLGPMNFREFLWATGQEYLDELLMKKKMTDEVHQAGISALKNFYYVGGMPEAVKEYAESKSLARVREIQSQIIQAYTADFPKYNQRISVQRIARIYANIALNLGKKIVYSKIDEESQSREIKRVLELLIDARVITPCLHSDGNQPPLLASADERIFKLYYLDIGLLGAALDTSLDGIERELKQQDGVFAEQFVAQHLCYPLDQSAAPSLYYYLRDKGSQKSEVDFLIEKNHKIIPVEVKSSAIGHLKSLKLFCEAKKSMCAVKASLTSFGRYENFTGGTELISIPLYAIDYFRQWDE